MVKKNTCIVVYDADQEDGQAVQSMLGRDVAAAEVTWCCAEADVSAKLSSSSYDLVVLVRDKEASDLLHLVDAAGEAVVIAVAPSGQEDWIVRALDRGAYEYLIKRDRRLYLHLLSIRIRHALEARQAQVALRASEARYLELFDQAPDIYILTGRDSRIRTINVSGAKQLGYRVEQLTGGSVADLVHAEDRELFEREMKRTFEQAGRTHQVECKFIHKSAADMHVSVRMRAQPVVASDSESEYELRMICRDITAEYEAARREQMLQERLARTERLQSLAILAGGVAHDLNNVLMPMVAYPDLLLSSFQENDPEYEDILEIKRSAQSAADIVQDLLTMARRGTVEKKTVQLNDVVSAFWRTTTGRDLGKRYPSVRVVQHLSDDLFPIAGSESHLGKVLMNLLINAMEAMPEGGTLSVTTENRVLEKPIHGYETIAEGAYAVLVVGDTGVGISLKDRERIFEPFYSRKKLGRSGTGLGLPVVYGVVKDHDGFVDVQPGSAGGTRFYLYFPHGEIASEMEDGHGAASSRGHERVLIVDDLPEQRDIARRLLERLGYQVSMAENGREAVRLFQSQSTSAENARDNPATLFDLVMVDMIMEEDFDGLDTFEAIRKLAPQQRCVIMSGFAETDRVKRALELGASAFVRKPYTMELLGKSVRRALGGKASHDHAMSP